jgi:hypothetical protein
MTHAVVTRFFRHAIGSPKIHSVTVIEDGISSDGRAYIYRKEYDVEWSRSCGYYLFHHSGSGGDTVVTVSGLYHVTGGAAVKEEPAEWVDARDHAPWRGRRTRVIRKRNRTRRMQRPPRMIDLEPGEDVLAWLEREGVEEQAVWCSECHDHIRGDELCKHCWWCDKIGWYSTPSERCGCQTRGACEA